MCIIVYLPVLRIRDVYPDPVFLPSRISDPRSNTNNKEERKTFVLSYLYLLLNISQNLKLFIFEMVQNKFEPVDKEFQYF